MREMSSVKMSILQVVIGRQRAHQGGGVDLATEGDLASIVYVLGCAMRLANIPDKRPAYKAETRRKLTASFGVAPFIPASRQAQQN